VAELLDGIGDGERAGVRLTDLALDRPGNRS
jgi:hypothetical protein